MMVIKLRLISKVREVPIGASNRNPGQELPIRAPSEDQDPKLGEMIFFYGLKDF